MRVLCSTTSGAGHYRPLFPIAQALVDAGHELVFACPESAVDAIRSAGFEVRSFADAEENDEQRRLFERFAETGDATFGERAIGLGFGLLWPLAALPGLETAWSEVRPDLVVRDPAEFGSLMLSERHAVPSVIGMGGLQSIFRFLGQFVKPPLAELRQRVGDGEAPWLSDRLIVTPTPPSFDEPSGETIAVQRYRRAAAGPAVEPADPPRVYATLGTEVMGSHRGPPLLSTILEAFARAEVTGIVTTGIEVDGEDHAPIPPGVEILDFVPHADVVPASRVVVTHGGAGTVQDALTMGRPMVVLPQFADQFLNGNRVEAVGIGRVLIGEDQTPDELADAIRHVLTGDFDHASRSIAEEAASLPPIDDVVGRLESMVTG